MHFHPSSNHIPGPTASTAWLLPLNAVYLAGRTLHSFTLQRRTPAPGETLLPHVVVGSLRAGGSGKTPFCLALSRVLAEVGLRPAILCSNLEGPDRGLRRATPDWRQGSDEASLLHVQGVATYVTGHRLQAWRSLSAAAEHDLIISDGGFQDQRLRGALRLLLCEPGEHPQFRDLLPAGRFRETWRAARRADLIVYGPGAPGEEAPDHHFQRKLIFPSGFDFGRDWVALCALGNNARFLDDLRGQGVRLAGVATRPDHRQFPAAEIERLVRRHPGCGLLATAKDHVKLEDPGARERIVRIDEKITISDAIGERVIAFAAAGGRRA